MSFLGYDTFVTLSSRHSNMIATRQSYSPLHRGRRPPLDSVPGHENAEFLCLQPRPEFSFKTASAPRINVNDALLVALFEISSPQFSLSRRRTVRSACVRITANLTCSSVRLRLKWMMCN